VRHEIEYRNALGFIVTEVVEHETPMDKLTARVQFESFRKAIEGAPVQVLSIKAV
jgi:hypothetical protein